MEKTIQRFPIFEAGHVFNKINREITSKLKSSYISLDYPCRLCAMVIDSSQLAYNKSMIFTPGEVGISIEMFIRVTVKVISNDGGILKISDSTKRKSLVKHAYKLVCNALNVNPSVEITVDDSEIPNHCGFGSSSSTISAVASAINELYGTPIKNYELIKYLAGNHGEELSDFDLDRLKSVQCIGGGATSGLIEEGIFIITGRSSVISKMSYPGKIIIGLPKSFKKQSAEVLMKLEEENIWKYEQIGKLFKDKISFDILHHALPEMLEGKIKSLSEIVFFERFEIQYDKRFAGGSVDANSFVCPEMKTIAKKLIPIYKNNRCTMLGLSSVGPAFFVIVENKEDENFCKDIMEKLGMKIFNSNVCNTTYHIVSKK